MTVASSTSRVQYNCSGGTTYAFSFGVGATSEIQVILTSSTGVETILAETTHYTVTATNSDYSSGGTLTTVAAYAAPNKITIIRNVPLTQESDFVEGMPTLYESFEDGLDKLTRITQQQQEEIDRSLKLSVSSEATATLPPSANSYIGWNSDATALENKAAPVITTATQYEVDALVSYGGGTSYTKATIDAALTAIGTVNKATLLIRPGTWPIDVDADYSSYDNITWKIPAGTIFQVATTKTLTLAGTMESGLYKQFDCVGTGKVVFAQGTVDEVSPLLWGFSGTATANENYKAIMAAYNSLAPGIVFPAGSFDYDTGLVFTRGTLKFKGSGGPANHALPAATTHPQSTFLNYTGSGDAMTIDGDDVNGSYNYHFADFCLTGNVNATGGILIGSSATTPVIMSSFKNITVDYFSKISAYSWKILRMQQSVFENCYGHQSYFGWIIDGLNTTLSFTNNHAISNTLYGWYIVGLIGSSLNQCLAESNGDSGLAIYSNGVQSVQFNQWHSESNNTATGDAPIYITGPATAPLYLQFNGGYFGDAVSGVTFKLDYAERITWNEPTLAGVISVTANTKNSVFNTWNQSMLYNDIVGNAIGRVAIGNNNTEVSWTDYSGTSTITGFASYTTKSIYYKVIGKTVYVTFDIAGVSNSASTKFTVPIAASNTVPPYVCVMTQDNGTYTTTGGVAFLPKNSSLVTITKTMAGAGSDWTASGNKNVAGQFWYSIP